MNIINSLSAEQLRRAAAIKEQIDALENELGSILGGSGSASTGRVAGGRRAMSASARERIAAAQRARWAKYKSNKPAKAGRPGRRKMSPAAKAKIAAAARARWAKAKAAGRSHL